MKKKGAGVGALLYEANTSRYSASGRTGGKLLGIKRGVRRDAGNAPKVKLGGRAAMERSDSLWKNETGKFGREKVRKTETFPVQIP